MCEIIETRYLYSSNYNLTLFFKEDDVVDGRLCLIDDNNTSVFNFEGILAREKTRLSIAFFINWSLLDNPTWGFTAFTCELIDNDVARVNWLTIANNSSDPHSHGVDYLYSKNLFTKFQHVTSLQVPFPSKAQLRIGL